MVFRVLAEPREGASTAFRLAGRLTDDAADVLVDACAAVPTGVTIDLSEVLYADARGVTALGDLRARGALLCGATPYLALLLEQEAQGRRGGRSQQRTQEEGR